MHVEMIILRIFRSREQTTAFRGSEHAKILITLSSGLKIMLSMRIVTIKFADSDRS